MSYRVLVVEDHESNMELATDVLELAGYQVLQAFDAEEGIELAKREKPDLIVMDVGLPGMDGLEATRLLKADPATQHIPVLASTSHAMKGDRERILAAGCDAYISKPIDTRGFARIVADLIAGRQGGRGED